MGDRGGADPAQAPSGPQGLLRLQLLYWRYCVWVVPNADLRGALWRLAQQYVLMTMELQNVHAENARMRVEEGLVRVEMERERANIGAMRVRVRENGRLRAENERLRAENARVREEAAREREEAARLLSDNERLSNGVHSAADESERPSGGLQAVVEADAGMQMGDAVMEEAAEPTMAAFHGRFLASLGARVHQ